MVVVRLLDFGGGRLSLRFWWWLSISFDSGGGLINFDGGLLLLFSAWLLDSSVLPVAIRDFVHGENSYFGGY